MPRETALRSEDDEYPMKEVQPRPQPGWFLNEQAPPRKLAAKFQPQLDADSVASYWRSKAQTFEEPPDVDPWLGEDLQTHAPGSAAETLAEASTRGMPKRRPPRAIYVAATVVAIGVGGVGLLLAADRLSDGALMQPAVAWAENILKPAEPTSVVAVQPSETKKDVVTATLDVADVQGKANTPIALWLRAVPGQPGRDIALKLEGLPSQAWLTTGTRLGAVWLLRPDELRDVKLMVPVAPPAPLELKVSAIEADTGALASPVKELSVLIEPAGGGPETAQNFAVDPPAPRAP